MFFSREHDVYTAEVFDDLLSRVGSVWCISSLTDTYGMYVK